METLEKLGATAEQIKAIEEYFKKEALSDVKNVKKADNEAQEEKKRIRNMMRIKKILQRRLKILRIDRMVFVSNFQIK